MDHRYGSGCRVGGLGVRRGWWLLSHSTVLECITRLESIWGGHRVVMCSFTAGRSGLLGRWFGGIRWGGGDSVGGGVAPEPGPTVLERIARLESIWGDHRVVMCSFTAGRSGWLTGSRVKVIVSLASSLYNQHDSATSGSPTKLLSHRKFSTPIKMHRIQLPGQERKYILFNRNAKMHY